MTRTDSQAPLVPERLSSEVVGEHRIFDVLRHRVALPPRRAAGPNREIDAFCLHMPDWVTVTALTARGDVLLVRQYRHGVDGMTLETPGGLVDPGEQAPQAAARELREETGYRAQRLQSLGWVHPNPAIQDNRLHMLLALDVEQEGERILDEHEDTEPVALSRHEVRRMLRTGEIRHALSALCLERAFAALSAMSRRRP